MRSLLITNVENYRTQPTLLTALVIFSAKMIQSKVCTTINQKSKNISDFRSFSFKFCLLFSLTENLTCFTCTLLNKYKQSARSFFKTFSVCSLHFSGGQIMKIEIFYEVFSNSRDSSPTYWIVNVDWGLVKSKTVAVYLYWKTWKLKIWR